MGWHNMKKVTAGVKELVNVNAVFHNRNRKKFISVLEEDIPDSIVGWLFVGNAMLLCWKQPADNFNAVLGARHEDYLFWVTVNSSITVQIMTDIGTEFIVSFIGFVLNFLLIFLLKQCIVDILPPQLPRKKMGVYYIMLEIIADRYFFWCRIFPETAGEVFFLGTEITGRVSKKVLEISST